MRTFWEPGNEKIKHDDVKEGGQRTSLFHSCSREEGKGFRTSNLEMGVGRSEDVGDELNAMRRVVECTQGVDDSLSVHEVI